MYTNNNDYNLNNFSDYEIKVKARCMTVSDDRLEEAVSTLKKSGVRITPQRHAVLEYLLTSMTHPTADEIYRALEGKFPNMSVATVYNNLRILKEIGLVRELTERKSTRLNSSHVANSYAVC